MGKNINYSWIIQFTDFHGNEALTQIDATYPIKRTALIEKAIKKIKTEFPWDCNNQRIRKLHELLNKFTKVEVLSLKDKYLPSYQIIPRLN